MNNFAASEKETRQKALLITLGFGALLVGGLVFNAMSGSRKALANDPKTHQQPTDILPKVNEPNLQPKTTQRHSATPQKKEDLSSKRKQAVDILDTP